MWQPNFGLMLLCLCSRIRRRPDPPNCCCEREHSVSRIFDALQRSESERSGVDTATLPQGPELLKHAERAVASTWDATLAREEPEETNIAVDDERA